MKLSLVKGSTNVTIYVFIQDSSVTTGAGLTGLVFDSASLSASQVRPLAVRVVVTLATQTVTGAYTSGGFVEIDSSNMPGVYRLDLPDAVCASGVDSTVVMLKGASNMAPVVLEIQLTTFDLNTDVIGTVTTLTGHTPQTGDSFVRIGDPTSADISTDIFNLAVDVLGIPTTAEFELRTLVAGSYFDPAFDTVANVTTVATTTTNTDMRGTDSAALASVCTEVRLAELAAANLPTDIAAIKAETALIVTDTGTTLDTKLNDIQGATFSSATDSLEAIRDRGDAEWITGAGGTDQFLMQTTTITGLVSQTSFNLTAGSADSGAYIGCIAVITDVSTATQKAIGVISAYSGSPNRTITLLNDPGIFTMANTDNISILADRSVKPASDNETITLASGQVSLLTATQASIDAIEADTNELQGDDVPTLIAGLNDPTSAVIADAVWDEVLTGATHNVVSSAGRRLRQLEAGLILHSGTAQAGSYGTITLDTGANANDDFYNHTRVVITANTGLEQERLVVDYDGTTKVAKISPPWVTIPDSSSEFEVEPALSHADTGWATIKIGLVVAATSTTVTLDSDASAVTDFYNDDIVKIHEGTGDGQIRVITAYNGTTKVATIHTAWLITPDTTSEYIVEDGHPYIPLINTNVEDVPTVSEFNARTLVAGSYFDPLNDVVANVTLAATVTTLTGHTAQTGDSFVRIGAAGVSLTDLGGMSTGMKAEVNAEMVDVESVDLVTQPGQETPSANQTRDKMLAHLYKIARNKVDQNATEFRIYNDDGIVVDQKATTSDDGTTYTRTELETGP